MFLCFLYRHYVMLFLQNVCTFSCSSCQLCCRNQGETLLTICECSNFPIILSVSDVLILNQTKDIQIFHCVCCLIRILCCICFHLITSPFLPMPLLAMIYGLVSSWTRSLVFWLALVWECDSPTSQPTKQIFFLMGLFYGLTPVHRRKAKVSTRSGWQFCFSFMYWS